MVCKTPEITSHALPTKIRDGIARRGPAARNQLQVSSQPLEIRSSSFIAQCRCMYVRNCRAGWLFFVIGCCSSSTCASSNIPISGYVVVVAVMGHGSQSFFFFFCLRCLEKLSASQCTFTPYWLAARHIHRVTPYLMYGAASFSPRSTPNRHVAHPCPSTQAFIRFNNSRGLLYLHTGDDLPSGTSCISFKPPSPIHGSLRVACRR